MKNLKLNITLSETILHGLLAFLHILWERHQLSFCLSLQGCLYSKQTWETEVMSASRAKGIFVYYQYNKDKVTLWGKGHAFLQPIIKDLGSLSVGSSAMMQTYCVYSFYESSTLPCVTWGTHRTNANANSLLPLLWVMKSSGFDPRNFCFCPWNSLRLNFQLAYWSFTVLDTHLTNTVIFEPHNSFNLFLYFDVVEYFFNMNLIYRYISVRIDYYNNSHSNLNISQWPSPKNL